MWILGDGSQFSRKRSERPCGLNSKGLSLCFFELNFTGCEPEFNSRMWDIAPRNGTLDRNTVSGWNSRADISGNARHFCDCELNYIGCESSRSTTGCEQKGHQHLLMSFFVSCVVEFEKAETQAFLALSARLFKSLTAKFEPSSSLNAFSHILTSVPTWSQISS